MSSKSKNVYIPPHRRKKHAPPEGEVTIPKHKTKEEDDHELFNNKFTRICCINLRRRDDRWRSFCSRMRSALGDQQHVQLVERFDAFDGAEIIKSLEYENIVSLNWDATKNAMYDKHICAPYTNKLMTAGEIGCAMSHVQLWKELLANDTDNILASSSSATTTMLILEDDAVFYAEKSNQKKYTRRNNNYHATRNGGRRHNDDDHHYKKSASSPSSPSLFLQALSSAWKILPADWDILYLGFSDRGERTYLPSHPDDELLLSVDLFRPEYGFHTHAYALTTSAAHVLLSNLPVTGPVDVWLADNQWFGLNIYCSVIANEGWQGQGACLVSQRKHDTHSDIAQSGRKEG